MLTGDMEMFNTPIVSRVLGQLVVSPLLYEHILCYYAYAPIDIHIMLTGAMEMFNTPVAVVSRVPGQLVVSPLLYENILCYYACLNGHILYYVNWGHEDV